MLHWLLEQNRHNDTGVIIGDNLRDNLLYTDMATDTTVRVDRAIAGIPPTDAQRVQITFGGAEADPLQGSAFADRLFGGAGDDTLAGGLGDDWLEGGEGDDQYQFGATDGKDTLVDMDGEGAVTINGTVIGTAQGTGQADVWALKLIDGTPMELTRRTQPVEDGTVLDDGYMPRRSGFSRESRVFALKAPPTKALAARIA